MRNFKTIVGEYTQKPHKNQTQNSLPAKKNPQQQLWPFLHILKEDLQVYIKR